MKNTDKLENKSEVQKKDEQLISRKAAIKKAGLLSLTTASLMFLQTRAKAGGSTTEPAPPPPW